MEVVIAGGSGFVGSYLARMLVAQHHQVTILSHSIISEVCAHLTKHQFDVSSVTFSSYEDYQGQGDVLINLAGESFGAKQITTRRLSLLLSSRLEILDKLKAKAKLPPIFLQGSAVAAYNEKSAEPQTEASAAAGTSDIAQLAHKLEAATLELVQQHQIAHYYILRFGIVLHRSGGLIKKASYIPPFTVIHGTNHVPFIELNDTCRALIFLCEHAAEIESGVVNLTSPQSATLKELLQCCYKGSRLPPIPIITGFLRLGDRRIQLLEVDQVIVPQVLLDHNFVFHAPNIKDIA